MEQYMVVLEEEEGIDDAVAYLCQRLDSTGFSVQMVEQPRKLLVVDLPSDEILKQASRLKLKKETTDGESRDFDVGKKTAFKDVDVDHFLLPFEKQHIIRTVLDQLQVASLVEREDDRIPFSGRRGFPSVLQHLRQGCQQRRQLQSFVVDVHQVVSGKVATTQHPSFRRSGVVAYSTPVHSLAKKKAIWNASKTALFFPAQEIRNYFGEQVAYYCAWINFYTKCLVVPGIAGATLFAYNSFKGYTVDDSPYVPIFSFFMVLWSALFLKLWRRRSTTLAVEWDTYDEQKTDIVRPEFTGKTRISPVTGQEELFYPDHLRYFSYCVSALVTVSLLMVVTVIMAMSLNLQGYVQPESTFFYVDALSRHAQPGGLFDPQSLVMRYVPVVLHVAVVQTLNRIYKRIARALTDWENHRTSQAYESSLILKRFFFEAFDSYIAIFYLAFAQRNILKVRLELTSLYMVDCIRRIGTELLLPILLQLALNGSVVRKIEKAKWQSKERVAHREAISDSHLDEYEEFDDYLEMVIAFGYVTMFASAFPFAAFVQIIYNLIEMKSDAYKLCFVVQRPPVIRANSIGSWQLVMHLQAWLSLFTNVLMFTFCSESMKSWCSTGCYCMGVFFLEHLFGALMTLILELPSDVPEAVDIKMQRQKYLEYQDGGKAKCG